MLSTSTSTPCGGAFIEHFSIAGSDITGADPVDPEYEYKPTKSTPSPPPAAAAAAAASSPKTPASPAAALRPISIIKTRGRANSKRIAAHRFERAQRSDEDKKPRGAFGRLIERIVHPRAGSLE